MALKKTGAHFVEKGEGIYVFDNNNKKYLDTVEKLLINLSSKGIYDHLEGGISRYTVDEKWIVPHFEKMLYDNIQYVNLLNNYLINKRSDYLKNKLEQTIKFINSEFRYPCRGFRWRRTTRQPSGALHVRGWPT